MGGKENYCRRVTQKKKKKTQSNGGWGNPRNQVRRKRGGVKESFKPGAERGNKRRGERSVGSRGNWGEGKRADPRTGVKKAHKIDKPW